MLEKTCQRHYGCAIRSHYHCKYNCRKKHTFGETCQILELSPSLPAKLSEIKIILRQKFVQKVINKYNIPESLRIDESSNYDFKKLLIESSCILSDKDMNFILDTFLSDKAITKEVSVDWVRKFLEVSNKKEYGKIKFFLIIILWYELTISNRHSYIFNHEKFKQTLKMKHQEFCKHSNPVISTFFRDEIKIT